MTHRLPLFKQLVRHGVNFEQLEAFRIIALANRLADRHMCHDFSLWHKNGYALPATIDHESGFTFWCCGKDDARANG